MMGGPSTSDLFHGDREPAQRVVWVARRLRVFDAIARVGISNDGVVGRVVCGQALLVMAMVRVPTRHSVWCVLVY